MRCPTLRELPLPRSGKTGWPWTEETPQLPDPMPDGSSWPRVSIVTPSYNQGEFIEETIRSVLLQGYPNLEYIIIDGGSDDDSVNIIRKYESSLTYWASEPDEGQSDALNKGFKRTTGTILAWLNSDDRLRPGAIQAAVKFFLQRPDVGIVYGDYNEIDAHSSLIGTYQAPNFNLHHQIVRNRILQPATCFQRKVWEKVGPLNINFHYAMDYDFWIRAALHFSIEHNSFLMADVRIHDQAKTVAQYMDSLHELERLYDSFFNLGNLPRPIRQYEPEARGANYFTMGREYLRNRQYRAARRAFSNAWQTYPRYPYKLIILPLWLDSILKTNIGLPLFHLATRVKNET